jgi:hypothetical protein
MELQTMHLSDFPNDSSSVAKNSLSIGKFCLALQQIEKAMLKLANDDYVSKIVSLGAENLYLRNRLRELNSSESMRQE